MKIQQQCCCCDQQHHQYCCGSRNPSPQVVLVLQDQKQRIEKRRIAMILLLLLALHQFTCIQNKQQQQRQLNPVFVASFASSAGQRKRCTATNSNTAVTTRDVFTSRSAKQQQQQQFYHRKRRRTRLHSITTAPDTMKSSSSFMHTRNGINATNLRDSRIPSSSFHQQQQQQQQSPQSMQQQLHHVNSTAVANDFHDGHVSSFIISDRKRQQLQPLINNSNNTAMDTAVNNTIKDTALRIPTPKQKVPAKPKRNSLKQVVQNMIRIRRRRNSKEQWKHRRARTAEEGIRREKTAEGNEAPKPILDTKKTKDTTKPSSNEKKQRTSRSRRRVQELAHIFQKTNMAIEKKTRRLSARLLLGMIYALANDVQELNVNVNAYDDTPIWDKHVNDVSITFARLGFQPLQITGSTAAHAIPNRSSHNGGSRVSSEKTSSSGSTATIEKSKYASNSVINGTALTRDDNDTITTSSTLTADEAFDQIDVDSSGYLDRDELIQALSLATSSTSSSLSSVLSMNDNVGSSNSSSGSIGTERFVIENLVSDLFKLYDINGDGVVDREEYRNMVADMAALQRRDDTTDRIDTANDDFNTASWMAGVGNSVQENVGRAQQWIQDKVPSIKEDMGNMLSEARSNITAPSLLSNLLPNKNSNNTDATMDDSISSRDEVFVDPVVQNAVGSIVFSDLRMDLRRLVFGAVPIIKHITPGGPLILEPFTCTITGSFSAQDVMNSFLLDAALRRLVVRVLRLRVGKFRDLTEGAVFTGRAWKTFGSSAEGGGPQVEVPELGSVEFVNDKLIITGTARVQTSPTAQVIEQTFKVRTKVGTGTSGRYIRLEEPEVALVIKCPKSFEEASGKVCDMLGMNRPEPPPPIYTYFPIYSPFKPVADNEGFYLGEDNCIREIYVVDGALRFEMSALLRPGRFLGSHYIAFSVPIRTFIVTLDRVTDGIRAALREKKEAARARRNNNIDDDNDSGATSTEELLEEDESQQNHSSRRIPKVKSFFARFFDGYSQEQDDKEKEQLTEAIRDFFGRQEIDIEDRTV